jgi:hypothetical protein
MWTVYSSRSEDLVLPGTGTRKQERAGFAGCDQENEPDPLIRSCPFSYPFFLIRFLPDATKKMNLTPYPFLIRFLSVSYPFLTPYPFLIRSFSSSPYFGVAWRRMAPLSGKPTAAANRLPSGENATAGGERFGS